MNAVKMLSKIINQVTSSNLWQRMFIHQIDEEKMNEYKHQHRLLSMNIRNF